MKNLKIIIAVAAVSILTYIVPVSVNAQTVNEINKDLGVGGMFGEPTGISVKVWTGNKSAFDIGAAWSLTGRNNEDLHLHSDFLIHSWFRDTQNLAFYYGVGGRLISSEDATAGIRVPFGLTYVFDNIPFDLFAEAAPILDLTPETELAGNGAVGLRFYF